MLSDKIKSPSASKCQLMPTLVGLDYANCYGLFSRLWCWDQETTQRILPNNPAYDSESMYFPLDVAVTSISLSFDALNIVTLRSFPGTTSTFLLSTILKLSLRFRTTTMKPSGICICKLVTLMKALLATKVSSFSSRQFKNLWKDWAESSALHQTVGSFVFHWDYATIKAIRW